MRRKLYIALFAVATITILAVLISIQYSDASDLPELNPPDKLLVISFKGKDSILRQRAVGALGTIKAKHAIPAIIPLLDDNNWMTRLEAAEALARIESPAIPELISALSSNDQYIRKGAVEALGQIGFSSDIRVEQALIWALDDKNSDVRSTAAYWLSQSISSTAKIAYKEYQKREKIIKEEKRKREEARRNSPYTKDEMLASVPADDDNKYAMYLGYSFPFEGYNDEEFFITLHQGTDREDILRIFHKEDNRYKIIKQMKPNPGKRGHFETVKKLRMKTEDGKSALLLYVPLVYPGTGYNLENTFFAVLPNNTLQKVEFESAASWYHNKLKEDEGVWKGAVHTFSDEAMDYTFYIWDKEDANCCPSAGKVLGTYKLTRKHRFDIKSMRFISKYRIAVDTYTRRPINSAPVANAGADRNMVICTGVTLDGSGSSDVDGDTLTYRWSVISKPDGSIVSLEGSKNKIASFVPDLDGNYVINLIVNDRKLDSTADTININSNPPDISDVFVPGGCFRMGDIIKEGQRDERPAHKICLNDFYIDKFEVTQGDYKKVTGNNPSYKQKLQYYKNIAASDLLSMRCNALPVSNVYWQDAFDYCTAIGKRLPTEAEWEYAASSGGLIEKYSGTNDITEIGNYAWIQSNSDNAIHTVGQKLPNGLGIHDMTGNAFEWVADRYGSVYYTYSPTNNPQGPRFGGNRVFRGGAYRYYDIKNNDLRTTYRGWDSSTSNGFGFRCARFASDDLGKSPNSKDTKACQEIGDGENDLNNKCIENKSIERRDTSEDDLNIKPKEEDTLDLIKPNNNRGFLNSVLISGATVFLAERQTGHKGLSKSGVITVLKTYIAKGDILTIKTKGVACRKFESFTKAIKTMTDDKAPIAYPSPPDCITFKVGTKVQEYKAVRFSRALQGKFIEVGYESNTYWISDTAFKE